MKAFFANLAYVLEGLSYVAALFLCLLRPIIRTPLSVLIHTAILALAVTVTVQDVAWAGIALSFLTLALTALLIQRTGKAAERQSDAAHAEIMTRHVAEVQNIYQDMRGWRHDYHNHLQTMKGHLALNQAEELRCYLDMLEKDLGSVDTTLKSGNLTLDAILNSKVSYARSRKITVNAKALVPEKLSVSDIDLCVILGNLLDNAVEACLRLEETDKRFIRVYIGVLKQQLYLSVTNAAGGEVAKVNGEYITTKGKNRGHGIKRINALAAKYGGYVNRQNEPGVFATEIMLPL